MEDFRFGRHLFQKPKSAPKTLSRQKEGPVIKQRLKTMSENRDLDLFRNATHLIAVERFASLYESSPEQLQQETFSEEMWAAEEDFLKKRSAMIEALFPQGCPARVCGVQFVENTSSQHKLSEGESVVVTGHSPLKVRKAADLSATPFEISYNWLVRETPKHEEQAKIVQRTDEDLLEMARKVLSPGARFLGTINVPLNINIDDDVEQVSLYSLEVNYRKDDGMLFATHAACGDVQALNIRIEVVDRENTNTRAVQVSYSDRETTCVGMLDHLTGEIKGVVKEQYSESLFVHTNEVLHVFSLQSVQGVDCVGDPTLGEYTTRCMAVASFSKACDLRRQQFESDTKSLDRDVHDFQLLDRYNDRLNWYAFRSSLEYPFDSKPEHSLEMRKTNQYIPYVDVWHDNRLMAELQAAETRALAVELDALKFETTVDRADKMNVLQPKHNLMTIHSQHDAPVLFFTNFKKRLMRAEVAIQLALPTNYYQNLAKQHVNMGNDLMCANNTLITAYDRFNKALRAARVRVPLDHYDSWRCEFDSKNHQCFCLMNKPTTEPGIRLDCSHIFHETCIEKWLHSRSTCPICRARVVDSANDADS